MYPSRFVHYDAGGPPKVAGWHNHRPMHAGQATVSRKGESRVLRGHPWIFRSDVAKRDGCAPGSVVRVLSPRGKALGFPFYSSRSEIELRMIERGEELSKEFLRARLAAAIAWRDEIAPGAE